MKFDEAIKVVEVLQVLSNGKSASLYNAAVKIDNFEGKYTVCGYAYKHVSPRFYINDDAVVKTWHSITNQEHIKLLLERTDWEPLAK